MYRRKTNKKKRSHGLERELVGMCGRFGKEERKFHPSHDVTVL